jgi:site-specific recombinase XerD
MKTVSIYSLKDLAIKLVKEKGYTDKSIGNFSYTWNALIRYMESKQISDYTSDVGQDYLKEHFGDRYPLNLSKSEKDYVRRIVILDDLLDKGILVLGKKKGMPRVFDGINGDYFNLFLSHIAQSYSKSTFRSYDLHLYYLNSFLLKDKLDLKNFTPQVATHFICTLKKTGYNTSKVQNIISNVRSFILYLVKNGIIKNCSLRVWNTIFRTKYESTPHIQSCYSHDEVESLLKNIDRSSIKGKRDYAMILLAVRYGMRAGDIVSLIFSNIDWEHNKITFCQSKTQTVNSFDLCEEVGSAIADYLQYARPSVKNPHIFVSCVAPYNEVSVSAFESAVTYWMKCANIDIRGRKHGPHALRHSLATNLLKNNTQMPVISDILGHNSVLSTKTYLRVDITMLEQCTLEVPIIPNNFYANIYEKV